MHYYEEAKNLSNKIGFYQAYKRKPIFHDAPEELTAENIWGASYLCSAVLQKCEQQKYHCITIDTLKDLQEEFKAETGYAVDSNELINKGWIRIVFGFVSITKAIAQAGHVAEKVQALSEELNFFLQIEKKQDHEKYTLDELNDLVLKYESSNDVKLNLDAAKAGHYWGSREQKVDLHNVSVYKIVLDNIGEFLFIEKIYQALYSDNEKHLQISGDILVAIFTNHIKVFPETPSLTEFIKNKVFTPFSDDQYYRVDFRYSEMPLQGNIHDKTGAILWNNLLSDTSFKDDKERMFFWYCRIILHDSHCEIYNFFSRIAKTKFLSAAKEIILADSDIGNGDNEFLKLKLDGAHTRLHNLQYYLAIEKGQQFLPDSTDLFELFEGLLMLERNHYDEILLGQEARAPLNYLISQVVLCCKVPDFKLVFSLLREVNQKPYIFWKTCFMIYYWRPDIIPFLLTEKDTASLGMSLLHKLELANSVSKEKVYIKTGLISESFSFLTKYISEETLLEPKQKALVIFQCLLKATIKKYKISGYNNVDLKTKDKQERVQLADNLRSVLEYSFLPGIIHGSGYRIRQLLYPTLIQDVFLFVQLYSPKDMLLNGTIGLPFAKLDLLDYLLQLITRKKKSNEIKEVEKLRSEICEVFTVEYLAAMNCKEVQMQDFFGDNKIKPGLPSWHSHTENEILIKWPEILLTLEEEELLDDFIDPEDLKFNKESDLYNKHNQFIAEKLRTHLSILLRAFNGVYKNQSELKITSSPVQSVLSKLENKITSFVTKYCTFKPSQGRYDIFNDRLERGYWISDKEELLPVIGGVLNKFNKNNKKRIIGELIKTEQVIRSLKLLDFVVSEDERKRLLEEISAHDIKAYLKGLSFTDMQFVVQGLSNDQKFINQAEEALQYTDAVIKNSKIGHRKEEDLVFTFRAKLLLAFHRKDETAIDSIESPVLTSYVKQQFSANAEKDFYKALIFLSKNEPEKAYEIFNRELSYSKEDRPTLALNRFASKLQWADKLERGQAKMILYKEALDEWMEFETNVSRDQVLQYLKDKIWYNKLHANEALQNDTVFDTIYHQLEAEMRLRQDFLEIRINSLMRRKMQVQAESLLTDAKEFHQLENGDYPEFIYQLETIVNTEETLTIMKSQYNRIFRSAPEVLIKIIPENINKYERLADFVLSEIIASSNNMLTYINSISTINYEDKYSDLLMLGLSSRMLNYQWNIQNMRGGYPDSDKANPGVIDFGILAPNQERLAICEAFILYGKNTSEIQKHNLKVFNYDHSRNLFYIIIYYKGDEGTFESSWEKYKATVLDFIIFPTGYALKNRTLTTVKGLNVNSSIKVGKSKHGKNTELFHVFININYRLTLKKQKAKNK